MASRTSSEMSWIDLNIPETLEGELHYESFLLPLFCLGLENGWDLVLFLDRILNAVFSLSSTSLLYGCHS